MTLTPSSLLNVLSPAHLTHPRRVRQHSNCSRRPPCLPSRVNDDLLYLYSFLTTPRFRNPVQSRATFLRRRPTARIVTPRSPPGTAISPHSSRSDINVCSLSIFLKFHAHVTLVSCLLLTAPGRQTTDGNLYGEPAARGTMTTRRAADGGCMLRVGGEEGGKEGGSTLTTHVQRCAARRLSHKPDSLGLRYLLQLQGHHWRSLPLRLC